MAATSPPIGIDLGTTYSCVAVFEGGKVNIIPDKGKHTIPSWVSFFGTTRLIGAGAKDVAALHPRDTVYDVKRFIGRKSDDPVIKEISQQNKKYIFKIEIGDKGPLIKVDYRGKETSFTPEQISAMILGHMKKMAEEYLNKNVKKAVITVPAYFTDSQRQATKDAGKIAGLEVMAIINEPTAAAIAYELEKNLKGSKNVLVFDFGGGTCDVSILNIKGSEISVKAIAGDSSLGGRDIDERLAKSCLDFFERKYSLDAKSSPTSMHRLQEACEKAKRTLSSAFETQICLENFFSGKPLVKSLSRERLNDLCKDLFQKTIEIVKCAMKDAKFAQCDIDDVVMVGGSSYIPEVKRLVQEYFDWKDLIISINPDESVAYGAAVHAAVLAGDQTENIKDILLMDVTPLSLGIELLGGRMSIIVDRNTTIPCRKENSYETVSDNQTEVAINVYEGERKLVKDNIKLGTFTLTGIPPAPAGESKVDVIFVLDASGILTVTAVDSAKTSNTKAIRIVQDKSRLSDQQIKEMIEQAKKIDEQDRMREEATKARRKFELFLSNVKQATNQPSCNLSNGEKEIVIDFCEQEFFWLDSNAVADIEEYDDRMNFANKELEEYMSRLKL